MDTIYATMVIIQTKEDLSQEGVYPEHHGKNEIWFIDSINDNLRLNQGRVNLLKDTYIQVDKGKVWLSGCDFTYRHRLSKYKGQWDRWGMRVRRSFHRKDKRKALPICERHFQLHRLDREHKQAKRYGKILKGWGVH
jgi:hypothetical protein